jgi:hypothetical protein
MGMNEIYMAMTWLCWRLRAKYSQEYLDKMAHSKLEELSTAENLAESVTLAAQDALVHLRSPYCGAGTADNLCNELCKQILLEAEEDDFQALLAANPRKIKEWTKNWGSFRAGRIRRI